MGVWGLAALGAVVSWHDWRTLRIPNALLAGAALLIAVAVAVTGRWMGAAAGAGVAGGLLALARMIGRGGLGLGDVKYGAVIGAALGPVAGFVAVGCAAVAGVLLATALWAVGRGGRGVPFPFGPCLAAGSVAAVWLTPVLLAGWAHLAP
jgi:leader peptidase (prepilin peptidase)/N-methyltransferase